MHRLHDNFQHCCVFLEVHFLPAFFERQGLAAQDSLLLSACCTLTANLGLSTGPQSADAPVVGPAAIPIQHF